MSDRLRFHLLTAAGVVIGTIVGFTLLIFINWLTGH